MFNEKYAKIKEKFVFDYIDHEMTIQQIADKYGINWATVQIQLNKQNAKKPWNYKKFRQKTMVGFICKKCGKDKREEEFHKRSDGVCGRHSQCKACHKEYDKKRFSKKHKSD